MSELEEPKLFGTNISAVDSASHKVVDESGELTGKVGQARP